MWLPFFGSEKSLAVKLLLLLLLEIVTVKSANSNVPDAIYNFETDPM